MPSPLAKTFSFIDSLKRVLADRLSPSGMKETLTQSAQNLQGMSADMETAASKSVLISDAQKQEAHKRVADALMAQLAGFGVAGATLWHGTPHVLKGNKFDASKIGTGEGAQAYGYGHYLAESRGVGQSYKDTLTKDLQGLLVPGAKGQPARVVHVGPNNYDGLAATDIFNSAVARALSKQVTGGDNAYLDPAVHEALKSSILNSRQIAAMQGWNPEYKKANATAANMLEDILSGQLRNARPEGSLYKVDVPDEILAKQVDWDAPLGAQQPEIKAALEQLLGDTKITASPAAATSSIIKDLEKELSPEYAAFQLGKRGVSGIKFLDASSRVAGEGNRNRVIFPEFEDYITILTRNDVPVPPRK
jgi:hypothetical protein